MSSGGVFKLIANDGKADRMIMATALLNQRIKNVMCARQEAGHDDATPTLVDLERTHILFVNAHFKPFAAIGYEYNKVRPATGTSTLGGSVTFSIPQFGDFFHDMVVHVQLSAFGSSELTAPTKASATAYPVNGEDFDGNALAGSTYSLVDSFGNAVTDTTGTYHNLVRYCEYPGNRLFARVKFDVNGNPLDEYTDALSCMLEKFTVAPGKRVGYNRMVGQENKLSGYRGVSRAVPSDAEGQSASYQAALDAAAPILADGNDANNGSNVSTARECFSVVAGPQTPKLVQPSLHIWNKLQFWFNNDARLSIPSVSIPYGQRFVTIDLADQNKLAFEQNNLWVKQTIDTDAVGGNHLVSYTPFPQSGTIGDITIQKMELYVNNIFVNPEVHDIFIKRVGFSLIRVWREHSNRVQDESEGEQQLTQLKWPVEYIYLCIKPSWNTKAGNASQWRDWHRCTRILDCSVDESITVEVPEGTLYDAGTKTIMGKLNQAQYELPMLTVDSLSVSAHGISIYDDFNDEFFNAYAPFHYGGHALQTPEDPGALFVNFALYPRSYQPSGHMNISRAREFFVKWKTSYVSPNSPAELKAVASAINFLLIADGSAVLRYTT